MSAPTEQDPGVHPEALLLPWLLGGRLNERERQEVQQHLNACAECRRELDSLQPLRQQMRAMVEQAPPPSARVHATVTARIAQRVARPTPLLEAIAGLCRDALRPRWAPALLILLLAGQLGALTWLLTTSRPGGGELHTRSAGNAPARVAVTFNPQATQRQVNEAVRDLGGKIVDGPTADGAYVIELGSISPQQTAARLRALRARGDLVQRIESVTREPSSLP